MAFRTVLGTTLGPIFGPRIILFNCHPGCYKIIAERVATLDSEEVETLLTSKAEWRVGQQTKSFYGHNALHAAACNTRNVFNFTCSLEQRSMDQSSSDLPPPGFIFQIEDLEAKKLF